MNFNELLRMARPSIELTYTSRLTVLTAVPYIKPNGADGTRWVEGVIGDKNLLSDGDQTIQLTPTSHAEFHLTEPWEIGAYYTLSLHATLNNGSGKDGQYAYIMKNPAPGTTNFKDDTLSIVNLPSSTAKISQVKLVKGAVEAPCRLSRDKRVNTSQTEGNLNTNQHLLFCAPEISIPAGSRLMIDGEKFERTQEPMVYPSHQEVTVTKHEWA